MVIRAPFGGGVHGGLYHSQSVEALFFHVPGLKIVVPSHAVRRKGLLKAAIRDPDPVLFFEHKKGYRARQGRGARRATTSIPIGKADVKRGGHRHHGDHLWHGRALCLEAARAAGAGGHSASRCSTCARCCRWTGRPSLDGRRKTSKVLIVHEDNKTGGIGAEVAAIIAEECFFDLDGPIMRLCGPDVPAMPYAGPMEKFYMLIAGEAASRPCASLAQF